MYSAKLTINSQTLDLNYGNGYIINTIDGLTGLSARLNTVQDADGMGEVFTNGSVGGRTITITGVILDGNTEKKQALIDKIVPYGKGTLTILDKRTTLATRPSEYMSIDVVVSATPTITQEKHAKFAFTLYAPLPFWYDYEETTLTHTGDQDVTITGDVDTDYLLAIGIPANVQLSQFLIYFDQGATNARYLYLDFRRLSAGYVGTTVSSRVVMQRIDGRVSLKLQVTGSADQNIIKCLNVNSDLFRLPVGAHHVNVYATDPNDQTISTVAWTLVWHPKHTGVILVGN